MVWIADEAGQGELIGCPPLVFAGAGRCRKEAREPRFDHMHAVGEVLVHQHLVSTLVLVWYLIYIRCYCRN